jgi:predicted nucleic acid-binding protein
LEPAVIAVDTNVIIRLLTGDDQKQSARAKRLFETEAIWLSKTVLLEAEWILRRLYQLDRAQVVGALIALAALPNVSCEDDAAVAEALDWALKGLDFADALHLASARSARRFATFDAALAKRTKRLSTEIVVMTL